MKTFNVVELLGKAHSKLVKAYENDLIDFENFDYISDCIIEAQKAYVANFDYNKQNEVLTFKDRKEVK